MYAHLNIILLCKLSALLEFLVMVNFNIILYNVCIGSTGLWAPSVELVLTITLNGAQSSVLQSNPLWCEIGCKMGRLKYV